MTDLGASLVRRGGCLAAAASLGAVWPGSVGAVSPTPAAADSPGSAAAATLRVNTTRDELVPHDGRCSLREAVAAVNRPAVRTDCGPVGRTSDTIVLRPGRYALSIPPAGSDGNTSGDLDVTGRARLTIVGAGPGATVIDAHGLGDRVLSVSLRARVTLRRLRITGGHAPGSLPGSPGGCTAPGAGGPAVTGSAGNGGGVFNAGSLVLDAVSVIANAAGSGGSGGQGGPGGCGGGAGGQGESGGGVYNGGRLTVFDSTIQGNSAGAGGAGGAGGVGGLGGDGGGIYNRGRLSVLSSTVYENRAGSGGIGGPGGIGGQMPGMDGAGGPGGSGGGVYSTYGRLRVINSTIVDNRAGDGGAGASPAGTGGSGGDGGAVAAWASPSLIDSATLAGNAVGVGGGGGSPAGGSGAGGTGGTLFAAPSTPAGDMRVKNTILASGRGRACAGATSSAIADDGHDLSYHEDGCPGRNANPRLGSLSDNGGPTHTIALAAGSAAIDRIPRGSGDCRGADQRGVSRPQGRACDIGAYEFARPKITIIAPFHQASYERGSRIRARFRCGEGSVASTIASCRGTVRPGHPIRTGQVGSERFVVTAIDKSGHRATKVIRYSVWEYVNPLREVSGLTPRRIDLGVDYAGSGPLLAIGSGTVTMATDTDSGPPSCWAISCWPGGGIVVYRLSDGPYAGRYVYMAEHITVSVRPGQSVRAGQQIATLYAGYPWVEFGWAVGPGPEALAMTDGHRCPCSDPGGWSTIDGRNMDSLLVRLRAPSGYLQPGVPNQSMPAGWPTWSG